MPTEEVPTSPEPKAPNPSSSASANTANSRYADYERHELWELIEELEDDRRWARLREGIWISILAHILFFSLVSWGPQYLLHMPKVVNPSDLLRNRKDLTYLDLPPDALKQIRPKTPQVISDKDRTAQSPKPSLDKKTLQQLQAMTKAEQKAEQQQAAQQPPAPQPQVQAPQGPALPQLPHTQPQQQAQLEAPRPSSVPARPSFNTGPLSARDQLNQAVRGSAHGGQYGSGSDGVPNVAPRNPSLQGGVQILSDTMGVDFAPYLSALKRETYRSWEPLIPESVRPPLLKKGVVQIQFKILPDGSVKEMRLVGPSGDVPLDRAAWGAITGSRYPTLPHQFKGPYLELRFAFFYNP